MLRCKKQNTNSASFFSCLNCNPNGREIYEKSPCRTANQQDFRKLKSRDGFPFGRKSNDEYYIYGEQVGEIRMSEGNPNAQKVSISHLKNRKSLKSFHKTQLHQEKPSLSKLTLDQNLMTTMSSQPDYSLHRTLNSETTIKIQDTIKINNSYRTVRQSNPNIAFRYQSPLCLTGSSTKTNTKGCQNTIQAPLKQSQIAIDYPQEEPLNVQFISKTLSQLYPKKQILESMDYKLEIKGNLINNPQSKSIKLKKQQNNAENDRVPFKCRQTVSIKQAAEEDTHQSIVIFHSNKPTIPHGLLGSIKEYDQLQNSVSSTTVFKRKDNPFAQFK